MFQATSVLLNRSRWGLLQSCIRRTFPARSRSTTETTLHFCFGRGFGCLGSFAEGPTTRSTTIDFNSLPQPYPIPSLRRFSSSSTDTITSSSIGQDLSLQIEGGGQELNLSSKDKGNISLYAVWLRHNCQCPECLTDEDQSTIGPEQLDPSIAIHSADISDNKLNLTWSSGHRGYIDVDWLEKKTNVDTVSNSTLPVVSTVPRLDAVGIFKDVEKQWKWLHVANEYGLCVLTNYGTEHNSVTKLAKLMYNVQPSIFGEVFDVISEASPADLAYSSSYLPLHTDLPYYESAPGILLLHCIRFDSSVVGGESILMDPLPVIEELKTKFPEHYDTFLRVPATFKRSRLDTVNGVSGSTFSYHIPHIVLDINGKVTAFRWSTASTRPPLIPKEDILPYYAAYKCFAELLQRSSMKLKFRLEPGEVLTFNNRRLLHSREEIKLNGGVRHLQGTYANIDEFKSKCQVLNYKLGENNLVRRVLNNSVININ